MKTNYWKKVGIPFVVVLRLILPFFLWRFTFLTLFLVLFVDLVDGGEVFRRAFSSRKNSTYQLIDKSLDFYWYCFALIFSVGSPIFNFLLFFFVLRAIGMIVFLIRREKGVFLFFPNIFENLFIFYIVTLAYPSLTRFLEGGYFYAVLLILIATKIIHEYVLHTKNLSFYGTMFGKKWRED